MRRKEAAHGNLILHVIGGSSGKTKTTGVKEMVDDFDSESEVPVELRLPRGRLHATMAC